MDINRAARQRGKYPPLSQLLRWIVLLIHLGTSLSARQSGSAKCITWFNWKVNINHHCTYIQLLLEIYLTTYKMRGTANIVLLSLKPLVHILQVQGKFVWSTTEFVLKLCFRRTFYRFNQNYSFDQKWSYFFSRYEYLSLTKFEAEFFVWIYGQRGKKEKASSVS